MLDLDRLHAAARREGVSRRLFLAHASALAAVPLLGLRAEGRTLRRAARFAADPFGLGVASGDPDASGVVIWTRLAPEPLAPGGGMPAELVEVAWEVARDEGMTDVVKAGKAVATPQLGHSVHVEVDGLEAGRPYWYRFRAGDAESAVGRTRTMPEDSASPEQLKFAFASCQHYEAGFFTAYEHMAKDDLDLVVHLGDYIYEGPGRDRGVRKHSGDREIRTLEDYRIRHAQYRTDEHLREMHRLCPWIVTWDDHEFDNNYAAGVSEESGVDPVDFLERRANAYQAYYENMPLRRRSRPRGPELRLYRTANFGRLAAFQVLDTRQYRSDQPNNDRRSPLNAEALERSRSILGAEQAGWLKGALLESTATWNVLAQQVMMAMVARAVDADGQRLYSMDQWPGYAAERVALMDFIRTRRVPNPVVAAEFVGTSISSGGNGLAVVPKQDELLSENPGVRFFNAQRGYVRCTVTPDSWRSDYQVVEEVTRPGAPAVTKGAFVVEAGRPGVQPA